MYLTKDQISDCYNYIRDLVITMSGDCSFNEHINMRTKHAVSPVDMLDIAHI